MIQFGANAVFEAKGDKETDELADADIDAILAQGDEATRGMQQAVAAKLQGLGAGSGMLDFKMEGGSAQFFEGVDYSKNKAKLREEERLKKEAEREKNRALRTTIMAGATQDELLEAAGGAGAGGIGMPSCATVGKVGSCSAAKATSRGKLR